MVIFLCLTLSYYHHTAPFPPNVTDKITKQKIIHGKCIPSLTGTFQMQISVGSPLLSPGIQIKATVHSHRGIAGNSLSLPQTSPSSSQTARPKLLRTIQLANKVPTLEPSIRNP
ncbi:hypothetical protein GWI33_020516 [Rhynchophorus ferrugineus]|uniref:Uncharacterized protein n=1 Tax=Rhynchophorus ferrugineus TaxID=354439 RepID=A0A834M3B2_RHYFE|nr:hypothetical protein GWI33_020516 [Rhynchophorus ferrugineus]